MLTTASPMPQKAEVLAQELQEFSVDLFRARPSQAVGCSLDLNVLDPFDHFGLPPRRCIRRQNSVVVAVYDHGRYVVAGDVLAKILDPRINARQGADGGSAHCDIPIG